MEVVQGVGTDLAAVGVHEDGEAAAFGYHLGDGGADKGGVGVEVGGWGGVVGYAG